MKSVMCSWRIQEVYTWNLRLLSWDQDCPVDSSNDVWEAVDSIVEDAEECTVVGCVALTRRREELLDASRR